MSHNVGEYIRCALNRHMCKDDKEDIIYIKGPLSAKAHRDQQILSISQREDYNQSLLKPISTANPPATTVWLA